VKTHKKRLRVALTAIIAAVAVVALTIGYTVWFAYHSAHLADASLKSANAVSKDVPKLPQITTFDQCKAAPKSKLLETYPEQCVTAAGKTFTGTAQPTYLVIKEWGVRLLLPSNLQSMDYQIKGGYAYLGSPQVAALASTCTTEGAPLGMLERTRGLPDGITGSYMKLGGYYYIYFGSQSSCTDGATHGHDLAGTLQVNAENQLRKQLSVTLVGIN